MKFKNAMVALMMVLVAGLVMAAADIVGTIPAQTQAEDSAPWTLNLSAYDSGDANLTWSVSSVDTSLFSVGISTSNGDSIATFTPVANAFGSDVITFNLTDSVDSDSQDVTVTLTAVNDEPVWASISDQTAQEDVEFSLDLSSYVTDADGDTLTYSLVSGPSGSSVDSSTGLFTWTPDNSDSVTVNVSVSDGTANIGENFDVDIGPNLCDDGQIGKIRIDNWDIEDDNDDFYPKDIIVAEVDIENDYSSSDDDNDVEDIEVEMILYDLDEGDELASVTSDPFDLDQGDSEDGIDLELTIPSDIDVDNNIVVYLRVYEDGNEDENCRYEVYDDLDFEREKNDVTVEKFDLTPSSANPGDTISASIKVENIGSRDQDDVYVRIKNSELGIDVKSSEFDLDKYGKSDSDNKLSLIFDIPADAKAKSYEFELIVYDEDDDSYDSGNEFATLTVTGTGSSSNGGEFSPGVEPTIEFLSFNDKVNAGGSVSIPITLTNNAGVTKTYVLSLVNAADWADVSSDKTVFLTSGQRTTEYIYLNVNKEAQDGKHTGTILVKEGSSIVASKSFTVETSEGEEADSGEEVSLSGFKEFFNNSTFWWIVLDVALIIGAILLIFYLFGGRKRVK